jgi:hypothetical protein
MVSVCADAAALHTKAAAAATAKFRIVSSFEDAVQNG